VRSWLAQQAVDVAAPVAWAIDDTGFPKDGTGSPGLARQYSGSLGKVGNCQIGMSVHAVTDIVSCPLDWRLFLPESWDVVKAGPAAVKAARAKQRKTLTNTPRAVLPTGSSVVDVDVEAVTEAARQRRRKSAIPQDEGHRPKWMLVIEMIDGLAEHGLRPPLLAADSAANRYGSAFTTSIDFAAYLLESSARCEVDEEVDRHLDSRRLIHANAPMMMADGDLNRTPDAATHRDRLPPRRSTRDQTPRPRHRPPSRPATRERPNPTLAADLTDAHRGAARPQRTTLRRQTRRAAAALSRRPPPLRPPVAAHRQTPAVGRRPAESASTGCDTPPSPVDPAQAIEAAI
jgi:hypothetical protein